MKVIEVTGEDCLAELRGVSPEALARQSHDNFFRLFAAASPATA